MASPEKKSQKKCRVVRITGYGILDLRIQNYTLFERAAIDACCLLIFDGFDPENALRS